MNDRTSEQQTSIPPFPWLVADIGGSNARFGWIANAKTAISHIEILSVTQFSGPIEATSQYLTNLKNLLGSDFRAPRCAAFAVATDVGQDHIRFTNSPWSFSKTQIKTELDLNTFLVLNDFEALALSLPRLGSHQVQIIGNTPLKQGTMAVIGPGTGMGVGSVIESKHGWIAIPGEGGHATLAATDEVEELIFSYARNEFRHLSAERLLSGIGIPVLYRAIARARSKAYENFSTETIIELGLKDHDPVCAQTLNLFCALLGNFAGSIALILGAKGGVYIGGGIVPRLGKYFLQSRFREKFEAKGRLQSYLSNIPTVLITDNFAALSGAMLALEQSKVNSE